MIVKKAFKFQIYPTPPQQQQLAIQFGHARFVYNHFRRLREETYKKSGQGVCGHINENLRLHHRTWICESCQTLHHRDENAAMNLEMAA